MNRSMAQLKLDHLAAELDSLDRWTRLRDSEHGAFLVKELEARLGRTREMYRFVVATHPQVGALLAGIQGQEADLESIITKIKNVDDFKKSVDDEIEKLLHILRVDEETTGTVRESTLISSAVPRASETKQEAT